MYYQNNKEYYSNYQKMHSSQKKLKKIKIHNIKNFNKNKFKYIKPTILYGKFIIKLE